MLSTASIYCLFSPLLARSSCPMWLLKTQVSYLGKCFQVCNYILIMFLIESGFEMTLHGLIDCLDKERFNT